MSGVDEGKNQAGEEEQEEAPISEEQVYLAQLRQRKARLGANIQNVQNEIRYSGYDTSQLARSKSKQRIGLRQARSPNHFLAVPKRSLTAFMGEKREAGSHKMFESKVLVMIPPINEEITAQRKQQMPKQHAPALSFSHQDPFAFPGINGRHGGPAKRSVGGARRAAAASRRAQLVHQQKMLYQQQESVDREPLLLAERQWHATRYQNSSSVPEMGASTEEQPVTEYPLEPKHRTPTPKTKRLPMVAGEYLYIDSE
jgi:hypothetical protein